MGEDLIYTYKKWLPHTLVAIMAAVIGMSVVFVFLSHLSAVSFWILLVAIWASAFLALTIDYSKARRLIKGSIAGLPISDLTHALYWLSVICSDKARFGMGGINYWQSVDKVVNKIGGEFKPTWHSIVAGYKLPSARKLYAAVATMMVAMLGVFASLIFFKEFEIYAVGGLLVLVFIVLRVTGNQFKTLKLLADDPRVTEFGRSLIRNIVSWSSKNAARPLRVVLAGEAFGAEPVDSLYGYIIAEIRPASATLQSLPIEQPHSEEQVEKLIFRRKAAYVSAHVIVGLATGYIAVASLERILFGKADAFDLISGLFGFGIFAVGQYFVYSLGPEIKVMFQGGKADTWDFQMILNRVPKGRLQSLYAGDADFRQKVDFMLMLCQGKSVELSSLKEPIKMWLGEDAKQPEKFRYFKTEANNVALTDKGELLAKLVGKKAANIDKLLKKLEELQERARGYLQA